MTRLYERLFDDAAIFPPGNAPMAHAVAAHLEHKASTHGTFVGPMVCSAARLPELIAELESQSGAVELALVTGLAEFDDSVASALDETRLSLVAIEARMEVGGAVSGLPVGVAVWCEYPWGSDFELPAGTGLKLRTGGAEASDFPTEKELAAAIMMCAANNVSFKLTAGLHHAIRSTDPATGHEHHGFLNVILATHSALNDRAADSVVANLANRDSEHVAERIRRLSDKDVWAIRHAFHSFGTCSIADPINDLTALGLLDHGGLIDRAEPFGGGPA